MLFRANMPKVKKIALICLFCCGLFVTMAAVLRVVFIVTVGPNCPPITGFRSAPNSVKQDQQNGALLAGSWAVRETFVAVITTNLPMLFPLFKRWLSPLVSSISSSVGKGSKDSSRPPTLETFGKKAVRARPPRSVNHITNVTAFNDSQEYMVEMGALGRPVGGGGEKGSSDTSSDSDKTGAGAGIQRRVDVSVSQESGIPVSAGLRGNYTSASSRGGEPARTTYFADHITSDSYRHR